MRFTLQRSRSHERYNDPQGWEDVFSGTLDAVLERYDQFSHACRCSDAFRVFDASLGCYRPIAALQWAAAV
jgi:hypothetical protein